MNSSDTIDNMDSPSNKQPLSAAERAFGIWEIVENIIWLTLDAQRNEWLTIPNRMPALRKRGTTTQLVRYEDRLNTISYRLQFHCYLMLRQVARVWNNAFNTSRRLKFGRKFGSVAMTPFLIPGASVIRAPHCAGLWQLLTRHYCNSNKQFLLLESELTREFVLFLCTQAHYPGRVTRFSTRAVMMARYV